MLTSAGSPGAGQGRRSPRRTCSRRLTGAGTGPRRLPRRPARRSSLRGPAAMLAKAMDESREVPTATSFRTIAVDTLDAKRKALNKVLNERGMKVSFTHIVAWAIAQAAKSFPVMVRTFDERDGKPVAIEGGPVNLGIAVDVERKDGSHSLMVPAIKGADGLDFAAFHSYYEDLINKTRESKLTADDFQGTNISLTNPGGIGTVASVPRLMKGQSAIIATGSIAYPAEWAHATPDRLRALGVSKVMTLTSTYDHRVIQGAESGAFLRRIEQLLQGEDGFYEAIAADLGVEAGADHRRPRRLGLGAAARRAGAERTPGPARRGAAAGRAGGDLAAQGLPHPRPPGGAARPARPRAEGRPGDPAREPQPDAGADGPHPGLDPAHRRARRDPARGAAADARGLLRHDRLPVRAPLLPPAAHLAAGDGRDRRPPPAARAGREAAPAAPADRRLRVRALPREGLPGPEDLHDRGARRGRADARRAGHPRPPRRRRGGRLRDGPPRPAQRPRPQPRPLGRVDPRRVRGRQADRGGEGGRRDPARRHRRRQVPLRPPGHLRDRATARRSPSASTPTPATSSSSTRWSRARPASSSPTSTGPKLEHQPKRAVPVLLHGDAAFPGQGVVAETLNLRALRGYTTGGTVHVIQNNQVGFTTDPEDARSTPYAADMAKGFNVPIVHVNADDVEACSAAIRLAMAYRERWERDIVIDVIGYRRYGHNETDEPAYTQPLIAAKIKAHPPVSEIYAEKLVEEGVDLRARRSSGSPRSATPRCRARSRTCARRWSSASTKTRPSTTSATGELDRSASPPVETAVPIEKLRPLNEALIQAPESFTDPPQAAQTALEADRGAREGRDRIRPRRGARLRLAAHRRRPHPPHRPGHRARHLLPPPPRPPRREDRPRVLPDAEPRGRQRALRALQQPALGDRLPRLRVRLLGGDAERARPLGGAVRRLRQRRPGDHRQLHRLRRGEVGTDQPPHPAAAARLRGLGPGALERPDRALPGAGGRGQHPHRLPDHRRPVLPPAAPPGADPQAAAAGRLHPQGPAAPRPGRRRPRGADRGRASTSSSTTRPPRTAATKVERLVLCTGKVYFDMDANERREAAETRRHRPGRADLPVRQGTARAS